MSQRDYTSFSDWVNASGYNDGTAGAALNNVMREQKPKRPERRGGVWHAPEQPKFELPPLPEENHITCTFERITPATAAEYLKHNTNNPRNIMKKVVEKYANDMLNGKWEQNGEGIVFSKNGELRDGQHRLEAIVMAGVPVEMVVVRGVADDITLYDMGAKRTLSQLAGCTTNAAAIANCMCAGLTGKRKSSPGVVKDYIAGHRDALEKAVSVCGAGPGKSITRKRGIMTAVYLMMRDGAKSEDLREFIRAVNSGFPFGDWDSTSAFAFAAFIRGRMGRDDSAETMADNIQVTLNAYRDFAMARRGMRRIRGREATRQPGSSWRKSGAETGWNKGQVPRVVSLLPGETPKGEVRWGRFTS